MPNGMYKGYQIKWIIQHDVKYLIYMYKRKQIKLTREATIAMIWKHQNPKWINHPSDVDPTSGDRLI